MDPLEEYQTLEWFYSVDAAPFGDEDAVTDEIDDLHFANHFLTCTHDVLQALV